MFPMTITLHDQSQLDAILAGLQAANGAATKTQPAPPPETPEPKAKPKAEAKAEPKAKPEAAKEPEADDGAGESVEEHYARAAAAVTKLAKARGRNAAVAILEKFAAKSLKDVPVEGYDDVIRLCEKAMAEEPADA